MKKIALISHDSSLTGAPICLAELAAGLLASDFPAEIYFGAPSPGPLFNRYRLKGARIFFYGRQRRNKDLPLHRSRIGNRLRRLFIREEIEGVLANTLESFQAVRAAGRVQIPVIWMIHEMAEAYRDRKELSRIKKAAAAADFLVFNSRTSLKQLPVLGSGLREKATYIYNGVRIPDNREINKDYRPELGFSAGDIILGSIGDVAPLKGYDILIRAFASINRRFPATRLVIVGRQPEQFHDYYQDLTRLAAELGINGRLFFVGERERIQPWINSFDILIHPSRRESFGRVVVEALAHATPVVAARSGGVEEIDNGTGIIVLVENNDPDRLARAVGRLVESPSLRNSIGREGRLLAEQKFSLAASLTRLENKIAAAFAFDRI